MFKNPLNLILPALSSQAAAPVAAPPADDFADMAVARASDREALGAWRFALRQRMRGSSLTEWRRCMRDLEVGMGGRGSRRRATRVASRQFVEFGIVVPSRRSRRRSSNA